MIIGAHTILYSKKADEVRAFFRDVLQYPFVDAGHGWLIFALPPAELGIHPAEDEQYHELYLMCDDIEKTMSELKSRGVEFVRAVQEARFGKVTAIKLPGGLELGLYQPRHPTALNLSR
jgi:predicted enzyme related to lactoylglutathione lyase